MHTATTHSTSERVSRRGYREANLAQQLSSVAPCLQLAISRDDGL
jgi:hypothetical protein